MKKTLTNSNDKTKESAFSLLNLIQSEPSDNYVYTNYFKKYKLESPIEEEDSNRIFNDEKNYWILQNRNNKSKIFLESLRTHCENKSNCIIFIYGLPDSGKSEMGQSISFILSAYLKKIGYRSKVWVFFDIGNVAEHTEEFQKGDVILIDEMPELVGEGAYNTKKAMNNLTKIIRAYQLFFVYISPERIKFKVVNYYLEMCGKYKEKRLSRMVIFSKNYDPIGHCILPLHKKEKFRKWYNEKKMNNIKKVLSSGGNVKRMRDKKKLKSDIKRLLFKAQEIQATKKAELEFLIEELDLEESNAYIKKVIAGAFIRVERGTYEYDIKKSFDKEGIDYDEDDMIVDEEGTNCIYYDGMSFAEYVYEIEKQRCSPVVALARKLFIEGLRFRVIEEKTGKSTYWIQEHTSGEWRTTKIGYMLEEWWAKTIGASIDDLGGSNPDKPDLVNNGEIYSLKYRYETGNKLWFSKEKDLGPEWRLAKSLDRPFHLILYNNRWDNKVREVLVKTDGPDDVYVYKEEIKKLIMDDFKAINDSRRAKEFIDNIKGDI